MYIYCSTSKETTYVRFGKRFQHGKSINYLAMSPRVKDAYSYKLAELQYGYITEKEFNAWCEDALDSFVWEPSTSCFDYDSQSGMPIVTNVSQTKTLIGFIQRMEDNLPCEAFLVRGTQVGIGTDGEPLVDIVYEEQIEYAIQDLIDVVISALSKGFRFTEDADTSVDSFTFISGQTFQYKDKLFSYPRPSFVEDFEYTGPIMDKFKYEDEVSVDYDNLACIYINADDNGGVEELGDIIWEWSNSIYDKPQQFEEDHHFAIDIKSNGDIYICGDNEELHDFVDDYAISYEDVTIPNKLLQKFKSMKFYE